MLQDKDQDEIVEYFKEKIDGSMAKFQLSQIYYMAKDESENREKKDKLIEIASVKSFQIIREIIIDENNAIFETEDKNNKLYTVVVISGSKSMYGYYTLEQGLIGWISEKQGFVDATSHICRMLNIKNDSK